VSLRRRGALRRRHPSFHDATVLFEHETAEDAFAELARFTERLQRFVIEPERFRLEPTAA